MISMIMIIMTIMTIMTLRRETKTQPKVDDDEEPQNIFRPMQRSVRTMEDTKKKLEPS